MLNDPIDLMNFLLDLVLVAISIWLAWNAIATHLKGNLGGSMRMIAVGEESGSLDKQLDRLASEYRKRLDVVVKSLGEIIKPALILLAGALFIFLIVALLLPIYDLVRQSVNHSLGGG